MIRVSVVLPTYNRAPLLRYALNSVLCQEMAQLEIIVVDDGSEDQTHEMVRSFDSSLIRYFRHENNRGPAAARNTGIRAASGEYISFLDSDDLWKPGKLQADIAFLNNHLEVDGVFTDVEMYRGQEFTPSVADTHAPFQLLLAGRASPNGTVLEQWQMYLCLLEDMPVKIQAVTLRRSCIPDVGFFREDFVSGEDWEFLLRFSRSHRWGYIARPLVTQRVMPDSTLARYATEDARWLLERFIQEKRSLKGDPEATRAVSRGIAHHGRRLGWCYLHAGHRWRAILAYWRTFYAAQDLGSLIRIIGIAVPGSLRKHVGQIVSKIHSARYPFGQQHCRQV